MIDSNPGPNTFSKLNFKKLLPLFMIIVISTILQLTAFDMIKQNIKYGCHYVLTVLSMYRPTRMQQYCLLSLSQEVNVTRSRGLDHSLARALKYRMWLFRCIWCADIKVEGRSGGGGTPYEISNLLITHCKHTCIKLKKKMKKKISGSAHGKIIHAYEINMVKYIHLSQVLGNGTVYICRFTC